MRALIPRGGDLIPIYHQYTSAMEMPRNMHNPAILPPEWLFVKKSCLNNGLGIFFLEKTESGYHREKVVFLSH